MSDLISRQDAIDACTDRHGICIAKQRLLDLPSVQPRRGKWAGKGDSKGFGIFICDNCGKFSMMEYDFCPNCGCRMEEGDAE